MDRIGTEGVDAAISTINQASGTGITGDVDVAMGMLMAYSGKFLRHIGLWAFDQATQTSSDSYSQSEFPDKSTGTPKIGAYTLGRDKIMVNNTQQPKQSYVLTFLLRCSSISRRRGNQWKHTAIFAAISFDPYTS